MTRAGIVLLALFLASLFSQGILQADEYDPLESERKWRVVKEYSWMFETVRTESGVCFVVPSAAALKKYRRKKNGYETLLECMKKYCPAVGRMRFANEYGKDLSDLYAIIEMYAE